MDGGELYTHIVAAPGNRAHDGIDGITDDDRLLLDEQAERFVAWFERLLLQPDGGGDAWAPERLEYRFACSAPDGPDEQVLVAEEYAQGRLDWYAVDRDLGSTGLGEVPGAG